MTKGIKKAISTVLMLSLVAACTGCGQSSEETGEFSPKYSSDTEYKLSVAGTYSNFESLESAIERFYAYYPNGEIEYTYLDDYRNTIVHALAGQEAPDIYVVQPWMFKDPQFTSLFESAEVLSDPDLKIDLSQIRSGVRWEMENGDVLALPIFASSIGMLVNEDIFAKEKLEVPADYESLVKCCDKLKAAGYESPVMGANTNTSPGIGYAFAYPVFAKAVKDDRTVEEGLNALDPSAGEVMRDSLVRVKEFVDSSCIDVDKCTAEIEDDYNAVIMRFFEGDVPMMLCSGDVVSGTRKRESKSEAFIEKPFKYSFYVAPSGDKGGYYMDSVSILFSVNKNSSSLDMTNEFIRFLTSKGELGLMAEEKGLITPTKDYSIDEVYASLSDFPGDRTISFNDIELLDTAVKEFRAAAYAVVNGEMTVDEAVSAYGSLFGE
ncbi:ABC transporter substrate-binding protein [Butyrivibrio sp. MC2013]|uniref:ABC transporter substrate-binding protein n=1 Tax=Butyrivibrio sp. MC2013 TaxID=1280686 RepID=UPI0004262CC3|nr:ABC transporter substrate-binding protein [Butyrivibrio sp. MC2013]